MWEMAQNQLRDGEGKIFWEWDILYTLFSGLEIR